MTHDYRRNGLATLFAALTVADGTVIARCKPRHRHQEFLAFLKVLDAKTPERLDLHLIVDNYRTHKHPVVGEWLDAQGSTCTSRRRAPLGSTSSSATSPRPANRSAEGPSAT